MKRKYEFTSFSTLTVGLLLILVFLPRAAGQLLCAGFTAVWCGAALYRWYKARRVPAVRKPRADDRELAIQRMLQQTEGHLTDLLHGVYPDAQWRWESRRVADAILQGGTVRLSLKNAGPYERAEVSFADPARPAIRLVQCLNLQDVPAPQPMQPIQKEPQQEAPPVVKPVSPVDDPVAWYNLIGQNALTQIVTDLNAQGCRKLAIDTNGDVFAVEPKADPAPKSHLDRMPGAACWETLRTLLEQDDLHATVTPDRLLLNW